MGCSSLPQVLLGFTGLYWVLPGFTGFYWVLLGFTGFYWVVPSFTRGASIVLRQSIKEPIKPREMSESINKMKRFDRYYLVLPGFFHRDSTSSQRIKKKKPTKHAHTNEEERMEGKPSNRRYLVLPSFPATRVVRESPRNNQSKQPTRQKDTHTHTPNLTKAMVRHTRKPSKPR